MKDGAAPDATPKEFPREAARHLDSLPEGAGRLAVVTGATRALGLATTRALLRKGVAVVMACRNVAKAEKVVRRIRAERAGSEVEVLQLDLGSLTSIHTFANAFRERHDRLDLLFANAGIMAVKRCETEDGFEAQLGVNHLGHFALVGLLAPLLLATPGSRTVTTTSSAAFMGRIDLEDPMGERRYDRWRAYGQAKLANLLHAVALQRRLAAAGAGSTAHSAHPGFVHTNLQRNAAAAAGSRAERWLLGRLVPALGQGPEMGALPQVYAGMSPEASGGELWGPRWIHLRGRPVVVRAPAVASDREVQDRLWRLSEELTGVRYDLSG